jgi:hypothetical protein
MESDVITLQPLYKFNLDEIMPDGKVVGSLDPTSLRPTLLHKFERRGIEVPPELFGAPAGVGESAAPNFDRPYAEQEAAW